VGRDNGPQDEDALVRQGMMLADMLNGLDEQEAEEFENVLAMRAGRVGGSKKGEQKGKQKAKKTEAEKARSAGKRVRQKAAVDEPEQDNAALRQQLADDNQMIARSRRQLEAYKRAFGSV
jgi:hypothetical protein